MLEKFNILNSLKKENNNTGFKVPDNYFDSFESKMMRIIEVEEQPLSKKIITVIKPWLSLAAIFTLIVLIYYNTPYFKTSAQLVDAAFELDISIDILSSEFDEAELIAIIVEDNNNDIFNSINTNVEITNELTYDDIENLVIF